MINIYSEILNCSADFTDRTI